MQTSAIIAEVSAPAAGLPVFLAGSLVAEETYGLTNAHSDADLFCGTPQVLIATVQRFLSEGFTLDDRFTRVWARWLRYGFNNWHTNSIKLYSPSGIEVNLIYKLHNKHPTSSLGQVLESFDFGLLATGYDLEYGTFHDMRDFLFPGLDPKGPLPLMPNKRVNWRQGIFSQYNGLREAGRYAKYHNYGYDLSVVKDDLVTGYWESSKYYATAAKVERQPLGKIYETIAMLIEDDEIDQLAEASKEILYLDSLDEIMEALE